MEQQIQQNTQTIPVMTTTPTDSTLYAPSSVEKKRALIMYFLFGIMIVIADKKTNDFEYFHLKQSIGWWICFMVFLLVSVFVLFVPIIKYIGLIFLVLLMIVFIIFIKQTWDGKYHPELKNYPLALFSSLGNWLLSLFEIKFYENTQLPDSPNTPTNPPQMTQ